MLFRCGSPNGGGTEKVKVGTFTASTSVKTTVELGFQPKYLTVGVGTSSTFGVSTYNEDIWGSSQFLYGSSAGSSLKVSLPYTGVNRLSQITSTGFEYNKVSSGLTSAYYFAIG
jgi:hypothetical protein